MDVALRTGGLGKRYRRYPADQPRTIKEAALRGFRPTKKETFWAVRDVTLEIPAGRTVGVIGANGAGKSTLLRLLAGVEHPDEGSVEVNGRVGALLELGASFHPELTGRENVILAAVVAGLTRNQARARMDEIVEFAQLEEFIDSPLRTYSSGMQMRLAFSVASHVDPEILIVDEALSVGDISFQRRCIERLDRFRRDGVTIVFVSHDPGRVRQICDEVVWLRGGQVAAMGAPMEVAGLYVQSQADAAKRMTPQDAPIAFTPDGTVLEAHRNRFGSLRGTIESVRILTAWDEPCARIDTGSPVRLQIDYSTPSAGFISATIRRADEMICLDTVTTVPENDRHGRVILDVERLDLGGGEYVFDVGLYNQDWSETYDYHFGAYPFTVAGPSARAGLMAPPMQWRAHAEAVSR